MLTLVRNVFYRIELCLWPRLARISGRSSGHWNVPSLCLSVSDPYSSTGLTTLLYSRTNATTVKKKRLKWFGHVARMPQGRIPNYALDLTPRGKRKKRSTGSDLAFNSEKRKNGMKRNVPPKTEEWMLRVEASCSSRSWRERKKKKKKAYCVKALRRV